MDEVLTSFEATVIGQPRDGIENKSEFESFYKNRGRLGYQEERRKEILDNQKKNRSTKIDKFRGILSLVAAVEKNENNSIFREYVRYRPSIYVAGFNKTSPTYSNVLMFSEWIVEKPEDFNVNWLMVPCPKGVRVLVVAIRGTTKFYNKFGLFKFECATALPGGNRTILRTKHHNDCCVLDGFYQENTNTIHVLDLLAWNNQPMTDGETEFRNYWLKTQFAEIPELQSTQTKRNQIIFSLLPMVSCETESLSSFLSTYPLFKNNSPALDGLLFYHKKAHYVSGETPLVGWLYPYMVPEVLGSDVTINPAFMAEKPTNYINQAEFIKIFEQKRAKKNKRKSYSMDTSEVNDSEKTQGDAPVIAEKNDHSERVADMEHDPVADCTNTTRSEEEAMNTQGDAPVIAEKNGHSERVADMEHDPVADCTNTTTRSEEEAMNSNLELVTTDKSEKENLPESVAEMEQEPGNSPEEIKVT